MANLTKVKGSVETALKKLALLIGATLVGTSTGKTVQEVLDDMDARMDGIDDVQAKTLGMYIGQTVWHNYRPVIPGGLIPLDGQQLDVTADGVMVGLHDAAVAGLLPVTTEALWQSDPTKRNCYVIDVAGKIRLPDMNGSLPDSIKQPGVVGDNGTLQGQMQKGGVPNLTGRLTANLNWGVVTNLGNATGVFDIDTATTTPDLAGNGANNGGGRALLFRASKASDVYQDGLTEVRTNRAVGCWCVVAFGGASDLTGFDPATLASRIEAVNSASVTRDANITAGLQSGKRVARRVFNTVNGFQSAIPAVCSEDLRGKLVSFTALLSGTTGVPIMDAPLYIPEDAVTTGVTMNYRLGTWTYAFKLTSNNTLTMVSAGGGALGISYIDVITG